MLKLHTFGGLSVHAADRPLAGAAAQPRRMAVLAVLARGGARGATRGKLLALLWPDTGDEQGRRVLTQALYALRRDLGTDDVIAGTQELRLNRDVLWCDAFEFEAAIARGDLIEAATLYAGPFLDGFRLPGAPEFERWVDDERAAFQHRLRTAVETLARDAEARAEHREAVKWWRRRVADDPLSATTALSYMRALTAAGDRAEALQHARLFEALVDEELGLPPDRDVIAFAESLRHEPLAAPAAVTAHTAITKTVAVLPFAVLGRGDAVIECAEWCDMLAEQMLGAMLEVDGVSVMSRTASFAKGPNPSVAWLRDELRVSHAIEGAVQPGRDGFQVNVRLIAAADGRVIWWKKFAVPRGARGDAERERIAAQVAAGLPT